MTIYNSENLHNVSSKFFQIIILYNTSKIAKDFKICQIWPRWLVLEHVTLDSHKDGGYDVIEITHFSVLQLIFPFLGLRYLLASQ